MTVIISFSDIYFDDFFAIGITASPTPSTYWLRRSMGRRRASGGVGYSARAPADTNARHSQRPAAHIQLASAILLRGRYRRISIAPARVDMSRSGKRRADTRDRLGDAIRQREPARSMSASAWAFSPILGIPEFLAAYMACRCR